MFELRTLLVIVGILVAAFLVWIFLKKFKKRKSQLFEENLDGSFYSSGYNKKASFMNEIDIIIANSEKLGRVLNSSLDKSAVYMRILSDEILVSKLREAKNKKEVEEILLEWIKKNYSIIDEKEAKNKESKPPIKREGGPKAIPIKSKTVESKEVQKADLTKENKAGSGGEKVAEQKTKPAAELSDKDKMLANEIKEILESRNFERLIDIIKTLKEEQLESLMSFYREHFSSDKLGVLLKKSKGSSDVITLLRNEAINGLKEEYERVKNVIAQARKKGKNAQGEWLELMSVPAKIKMFGATFDKKDFYKIRDSLNKIEKSIADKMQEQKKESGPVAEKKTEEKPAEENKSNA
jgi:hypothetical protein